MKESLVEKNKEVEELKEKIKIYNDGEGQDILPFRGNDIQRFKSLLAYIQIGISYTQRKI